MLNFSLKKFNSYIFKIDASINAKALANKFRTILVLFLSSNFSNKVSI